MHSKIMIGSNKPVRLQKTSLGERLESGRPESGSIAHVIRLEMRSIGWYEFDRSPYTEQSIFNSIDVNKRIADDTTREV
jgi:hypothetical protein